jgi:TFIIB zinc-binding
MRMVKESMAVSLGASARCLSTHRSIMAYPKPFPLASPPKAQQAAFAPDLSVRLICLDCRDPNPTIVEEFGSGDLVCAGCGLVLGDRIVDTRSEWRVCAFAQLIIYSS